MFLEESPYLYLYGTLTLRGTSRYENRFFPDSLFLQQLPQWKDEIVAVNFVVPPDSHVVLFMEDSLFLSACRLYRNGVPLSREERERLLK